MGQPVLNKLNHMKTNRIIIAVLFFLVNFHQTSSQEVYDLSRCVISGLENNFSLKIAKTQELISGNNYTPGNAGYLPTITTTNRFGGNLNSTNQNLSDGSKTSTSGVHNNSGTANVKIGRASCRERV